MREEIATLRNEKNAMFGEMKEMETKNACLKAQLSEYNKIKQELNEKNVKIMNLEKIITEMKNDTTNEKNKQNDQMRELESKIMETKTNKFSHDLSHFTNELNKIRNEFNKSMGSNNISGSNNNYNNDFNFSLSISVKCQKFLNQIEKERNKIQVSFMHTQPRARALEVSCN